MTWFRRLAQNRLLDAGVVGIAVVCAVRIAVTLPSRAMENDFAHNYVSSRLLLEGRNPYSAPLAGEYARFGFAYDEDVPRASYPPTVQWLFAPFAALPPQAAFWTWVLAEVVSLGAILWLTRRLLRHRLSERGWRLVCAATVASATVYWHFYYSQLQLPLAAMMLAAYAWQREGRHTVACIGITIAGLIKFSPFFLLPWFVWRSGHGFRARLTQCGVVLASACLVVFATDVARWRDFYHYGMPVLAAWAVGRTFNFNVPSFITNMGFAAWRFSPPPTAARAWWALGMVAGLALTAVVYAWSLRTRRDCEVEFCLLSVAMLVAGGKSPGHFFVFLIFPMAVAAVRVVAEPSAWRVAWFAATWVLLNNLGTVANPFLDRHIYLEIVANYTPLLGLLMLGVFFVNELRRTKTGRVETRLPQAAGAAGGS